MESSQNVEAKLVMHDNYNKGIDSCTVGAGPPSVEQGDKNILKIHIFDISSVISGPILPKLSMHDHREGGAKSGKSCHTLKTIFLPNLNRL